MFKISRLTDYGVVLLRYLFERSGRSVEPFSARDLAKVSGLPLPTVSKLLKLMAKHGLVAAKRGASGGYELVEDPKSVSLLRLVLIFDGPPAVTSCMVENAHPCKIHRGCPQRNSWHLVQQKVAQVLTDISLFELMKPQSKNFGSLSGRYQDV